MSRTNRNRPNSKRKGQQPRRITVRSTRRNPPDLHRLSKALLELAAAQAEAEAQAAEQTKPDNAPAPQSTKNEPDRTSSRTYGEDAP